ncbi:Xaa-Pro peptidase family protein [Mesorhizobium sp. M1076]|uniref:Xaa-Pro peptidase family protein n=1 Tax=Mesorhizobium sp. M1076 TaxID=2957054 RepID=UPI003339516F
MSHAFPKVEYQERLARLRQAMNERGLSLIIVTNPANYNYISGYDAMSFQNPQALLVSNTDVEPVWIGRGIDRGSAENTTWLLGENIIGYADKYADNFPDHAMNAVADEIKKRGWNNGRIGYEGDSYYFSPRGFLTLQKGLPEAELVDVGAMVNWLRVIKSSREVEFMRRAGQMVTKVMGVAHDSLRAGIRENELAGRIMQAQAEGVGEYGGTCPSSIPFIVTGQHAGIPHASWTDDIMKHGSIAALELAGCYLRYHGALARTFSLGEPSAGLAQLADTVQEGLEAALAAMKPSATCHDVWAAWQGVLVRNGIEKHSRIGYSLGLSYPPSWREHTLSLESGREDEIREGMCFHIICGMFLGDGINKGDPHYELSETVLVTKSGVELLTNFDRQLTVIQTERV